jgi:hypothetical protein
VAEKRNLREDCGKWDFLINIWPGRNAYVVSGQIVVAKLGLSCWQGKLGLGGICAD